MILDLDIEWVDPKDSASTLLAWGRGVLKVGGVPVWYQGRRDSVEPIAWSWIELLEFLARNWLYINAEQSYPLGLILVDPSSLRSELKKKWEREDPGESRRDEDDESVFRFEERHDLSRGMHGIALPHVVIVRQGNDAWVCATDPPQLVPFKEVLADLTRIGEFIVHHIEKEHRSERVRMAVGSWNNRQSAQKQRLIQVVTQLTRAELLRAPRQNDLTYWELGTEINSDSELAAAARLVAGEETSPSDRDTVLKRIRSTPPVDTEAIDVLTSCTQDSLRERARDDYYEQGYALAHAPNRSRP